MVKLYVPAAVGVPESNPFGTKASPGGNAPPMIPKVYGAEPPDAPNVTLYGKC